MILVDGDEVLNRLGFRMLLPVHDELIGECPIENVKEASDRLSWCMVEAAKDLCVPSKCDVAVFDRWNGTEIEVEGL